ncbi:phage virion morphogenesis protein [Bdellovibrio bacteriovorus]|uniref:phage virion morphogenesis protein n=1 Tax=Bdellovibrio bacteriovorus TaxID=959 RepID=UPI003AA95814
MKDDILALMFTQRMDTFAKEESAEGKWEPLSKRHSAKRLAKVPKEKREPGAVKILQDKGFLRGSFTIPNGPMQEMSKSGEEVRLATHIPYAAIHNFGGTIQHPGTRNGFGRGVLIKPHSITIPARPFDQFREKDLTEMNELMEKYINE